jgi:hypothetical protein
MLDEFVVSLDAPGAANDDVDLFPARAFVPRRDLEAGLELRQAQAQRLLAQPPWLTSPVARYRCARLLRRRVSEQ